MVGLISLDDILSLLTEEFKEIGSLLGEESPTTSLFRTRDLEIARKNGSGHKLTLPNQLEVVITSPPNGVPRLCQVSPSMLSLVNLTEPSRNRTLAPPVWRLRTLLSL